VTFEEYVSQWDSLCGQIEELKRKLAPLAAQELTMRKAIRDSVKTALGDAWKEGTNNLILQDGRTLKVVQSVSRKIDQDLIEITRKTYELVNDRPVVFDDLLRVKYELAKEPFSKLSGEALLVVSRMITSKDEAPEVKLA
jgi:hypothetical protein